MSSANRIVGNCRDDVAARPRIRIQDGASAKFRFLAAGSRVKTNACPDIPNLRPLNWAAAK